MATKLTVFNGALALLGQREITALTDPVESRRHLERVWDNDFVKGILEQGLWNFAMRTVLSKDDPPAPAFGYLYRHAKPSDWVKTHKISAQPTFDPPLLRYSDEGAYWYLDYDEIYIQFVSRHPSYGANISNWPRSFSRYAEAELAVLVAPRILTLQEAQAKLDGPKGLWAHAKDMLNNAKSKDATNQPPEFPPEGSWVRSRRGDRFTVNGRD